MDLQLELHELLLSPGTHWQLRASLPSPEPVTEDVRGHRCSAVWASNGSAVALWYSTQDRSDVRGQYDAQGAFQVGDSCKTSKVCCCRLALLLWQGSDSGSLTASEASRREKSRQHRT